MRIVIDMQGAQTASRFRGIGRYTMAFAQAVVKNRGEHEILLALSGLLPDTIEPIRAAFEGLLPQENIRVWHAPGPVKEDQPGNDRRRETAELLREAFLASLQPDVIHISSLFEGYVDDAVTSIGRFDQVTPVSVILYDLIPLLNQDHYLKPNPRYEQYYLRKVEFLKQATLHLAISDFTRQEGIGALGLSDGKTITIFTALDNNFQPQAISDEIAGQVRAKLSITRPFVLYTGGADERKNLSCLIEAYAALPDSLRETHQLVLAGQMPEGNIAQFKHLARSAGLKDDDLVFTGYVSDEYLIQLYNLCQLYIFPSWHEGFGLPALEAMACGASVIGANTTSLPELIGLDEALFDPFDVNAITAKMAKALQDEAFRQRLCAHGLQQAKKFSWDETAKRAISAWEGLQLSNTMIGHQLQTDWKPRLAFVSPLPPERTGIADYSANLLPALSAYYDIELVVAQERVEDSWVNQHGKIRDVSWLRANAKSIDRVLYQMGNSPFHQHMLTLMAEIPGAVVLHDFYLSGLLAWLELHDGADHVWTKALYDSHGYTAVQARYQDAEAAKRRYPVNAHVLQNARGIIVHSKYSQSLAQQWYGAECSSDWCEVPLVRMPCRATDRLAARKHLGIAEQAFLVCSFGFQGPTKLNHRLLQSWLESALAQDKHCHLLFVGENHGGDYGAKLIRLIRASSCRDRIRITGFASPQLFTQCLAAADVAVQLRTQSRGETSAAVLDCMNHGLPVVVNANGTMAELDHDVVWMLPDEFENLALVDALEKFWRSPELRRKFGERALEYILAYHAPDACARQYAEAIETFYARAANDLPTLIQSLANKPDFEPTEAEVVQLAAVLGQNHPLPKLTRRLYLDVTATSRNDLKSGIERVARALILALLATPPEGYRIEPVYLSHENGRWLYRNARRYTLELIGCPTHAFEDDVFEPEADDVLLGLDLSGDSLVQAEQFGLFKDLRNHGIKVFATVFDLLPVRMPEVFPPGADQLHQNWLAAISSLDGAVCISKAVADDLCAWQDEAGMIWAQRRPYSIGWFHLGADIGNSAPTTGVPTEAEETLKALRFRPTFLMVGTIEPRKGYLQTLDAFDQLWREGVKANLVIVGHEGWMGQPENMRRDIPQTVTLLHSHPERNKRLFWLEGISDEYLEKVYAASTCLIAASYGEGFGLPLIEAAQHKLPIIARDIPVFREVAGEHAYYFDATSHEGLAQTVKRWLDQYQRGTHAKSDGMQWLKWMESARKLAQIVIGEVGRDKHKEIHMENQIKIGGSVYAVSSDDNYLEAMGNDFEPHMVQLFRALTDPEDVVADIGANIGLTAILFSSLAKKTYAFEPSPSTFRILSGNLTKNSIRNVEPINLGLGNKEETLTITFAQNNRSGGYVSDKIRPESGHVTEEIQIVTLDNFFSSRHPAPSFLKIDVEGYEQNVVQGGGAFLQRAQPVVVMEMNHFCLDVLQRITIPDFLDFMRSVFPYLYAIDTDNTTIIDLHVPDKAYMVMHEHVVKHRFPNLVGGFDIKIKEKLEITF